MRSILLNNRRKARTAASRCVALLGAATLLLSAGCGGGRNDAFSNLAPGSTGNVGGNTGGNNTGGGTQTTRLTVPIEWGARSRVAAPSSALSAKITVKDGRSDGKDYAWTVNRHSDPAAYSETVQSPEPVRTGARDVSVQFFGEANGAGAVVAQASQRVTIAANGGGLETINAVTSAIASIEVAPGQSLQQGQKKELVFTARDAAGNVVPITPGSVFVDVTGGANVVRVNAGTQIEALAPGTATIRVRLDGKESAPVTLDVSPSLTALSSPGPTDRQLETAGTLSGRLVGVPNFNNFAGGATLAQAIYLVPTSGAFFTGAETYLGLFGDDLPERDAQGNYTWSQTYQGITVTVRLRSTGDGGYNYSVTLNGGPYNNIVYYEASARRDTVDGKGAYRQTVTWRDPSQSGPVATSEALVFDDGTARGSLDFVGFYATYEVRADRSYYSANYSGDANDRRKAGEVILRADGTGEARSYCAQDNQAQDEVRFANFGNSGTITEFATACGGTAGLTSSWQ